jgi:hypothetical protein
MSCLRHDCHCARLTEHLRSCPLPYLGSPTVPTHDPSRPRDPAHPRKVIWAAPRMTARARCRSAPPGAGLTRRPELGLACGRREGRPDVPSRGSPPGNHHRVSSPCSERGGVTRSGVPDTSGAAENAEVCPVPAWRDRVGRTLSDAALGKLISPPAFNSESLAFAGAPRAGDRTAVRDTCRTPRNAQLSRFSAGCRDRISPRGHPARGAEDPQVIVNLE